MVPTLRCRKLAKNYIGVFVCFSTNAIHLELVRDLSTPMFLNALKRFFARRGLSSKNGTNFVGKSNKQLNQMYIQIYRYKL